MDVFVFRRIITYNMIHDNIGKIVIFNTFLDEHNFQNIDPEYKSYKQIHNMSLCSSMESFMFRRKELL